MEREEMGEGRRRGYNVEGGGGLEEEVGLTLLQD